ncbi:MAG: energy-coupling factor transporter ATPase [Clostridiales bacterium]|nr:energy-coupling factor transporter ATPase [Clostridiales bacterium]
MMTDIIRVEDLMFEYKQEGSEDSVKAIDGVSLSVERGSFTAIIGKNGSGKSTFAKHINALLLPSSGAVYVNGANTADEDKTWEIRQTVGMVFQNPDNQLVSSIVEDDVAFGPENLGIEPTEIRQRVDGALCAVDMYEARTMAPHLLSGGQKQRVAIAGVVAMAPECIIFDEPTAMLDPSGRREVMDIIKKLNARGITIVLITHFMEEAAAADRIIVMEDGKIALDGAPKEVFCNVGYIESLGLDVPLAARLSHKLRGRGIEVPAGIADTDELVGFLCQYR